VARNQYFATRTSLITIPCQVGNDMMKEKRQHTRPHKYVKFVIASAERVENVFKDEEREYEMILRKRSHRGAN